MINITPNSNEQDVLIIDIEPSQRYQIIGIISSHSDDEFFQNENIEPINLINEFNEFNQNNFPQTPNNRIRKRGPPSQKKIYLEAKRLRTIS